MPTSELAPSNDFPFSDEVELAETFISPRQRPRVDHWSNPLMQEFSRKAKPRTSTAKLAKKKNGLEQLVLDFGQKNRGPQTCKDCDMTFNHTVESDDGFHMIYHNAVLSGVDYAEYKDEIAVNKRWHEVFGNVRTVLVTRHSHLKEKKKVCCLEKLISRVR
jgi:hypothetical protein